MIPSASIPRPTCSASSPCSARRSAPSGPIAYVSHSTASFSAHGSCPHDPVFPLQSLAAQKVSACSASSASGHLSGQVSGPTGRPTIWIHSCSVGETLSVQPLAHALSQRFPTCSARIFSTITKTGQEIAQDRFKSNMAPETHFTSLLTWRVHRQPRAGPGFKPSMLITIDTEIWPNVLHEDKETRRIPVVMVNGRHFGPNRSPTIRWL